MLTFFRWSGILIGGFQCFHHIKEKHSVLPCGTPRLRENLDTALPLAADPKKNACAKQTNAPVQFSLRIGA